jgi:hypothetical protein
MNVAAIYNSLHENKNSKGSIVDNCWHIDAICTNYETIYQVLLTIR